MHLLDTTTGILEPIVDPRKERYAILSHVWQREGEQSFQDIEALRHSLVRRVSSALKGRRNRPVSVLSWASLKIRNCCEYARQRGYKKVWIDTCCIDKSSSSELSEALNSMYEWYGLADVCFAFLSDVTDQADPKKQNSAFRRSIWFQRGWTLQELIAPRSLVFVSKEWRFIGTKANLAHVIEKVTGIPAGILTHELPLESISVARRMSWASKRVTNKPEDEAYSLMGIFGVRMTTIYGEGRAAFLRLQEEILKHIHDESIFAWGSIFRVSSAGSSLRWRQEWKSGFDASVLFARSPAEFFYSGNIEPVALNDFEKRLGISVAVPHYNITSYGVRSSFPSIMIRQSTTSSIRLAVLACQVKPNGTQSTGRGKLIALLLTQQPNSSLQSGRYIVGALGSEIPSWLLDDPDSSSVSGSSTVKSYQSSRPSSESASGSGSTATSVTTLTDEMVYRAVVLPWSEHGDSATFYRPARADASHNVNDGGLTPVAVRRAKLCIVHRTLTGQAVGGNVIDSSWLAGLAWSASDSSDGAIYFECPCEVIVPGWNITDLARKGYSLWHPPKRCQHTVELPVGFPHSPAVHTLALCSESEVVLIYIAPCPNGGECKNGLKKPHLARSSSMVARASEPITTARRTLSEAYPEPQVAPGLCVSVSFVPTSNAHAAQSLEDHGRSLETCWMDHVDRWADGTKSYHRGSTTVRIQFSPCPGAWTRHLPATTPGRTIRGRFAGRPPYVHHAS